MNPFTVIFEDNHLIAVNKAPGILVQGDATGDTPLLEMVKQYIKVRYDKPGDVFLGSIHRIDRPVSGVVIFARTSKALTRMNELWRTRDVQKTYWAIVEKKPEPLNGELKHLLLKDTTRNKVTVFDRPSNRSKGAKEALLSYKLESRIAKSYLLEILPHTGRPHQIRAQLAHVGLPIKGDVKYGFEHPNEDASICLHSRSLSFIHPVKKEPITIVAKPPKRNGWELFQGT